MEPRIAHGIYNPFSQGIRQLRASIEADPELGDWEVRFLESQDKDPDKFLADLLEERADVIGFSCYVWSFSAFVGIAERLRKIQPNVRILFGGPAARTVMFKMPRFVGREQVVDAMVAGEGEWAISSLLRQRDWDLPTLTAIPGVWVPTQFGWRGGLPQLADRPLDDLPSGILAGFSDSQRTGTMERFRGCPMSCGFCQWGDQTTPHRVFSEERMHAELSYLKSRNFRSFNLIDAGLNLNSKAFRNFARAEADVGLLKEAKLFGSIYPSIVNDEHLEFLSRCNKPTLDVGVQSFNPAALAAMDRPFREDRFETVMANLMQVSEPEPELIFGLPGDNPKAFKEGILRLCKIGCRVRAFHCLVLPDALMSRAKPEHQLKWDPDTLLVTSCLGWSERDLAETRDWLDELVATQTGDAGDNTWTFCPLQPGVRMPSLQLRPIRHTHESLTAELQPAMERWTTGAWSVHETGFTDEGIRVRLRTPTLDFHVDLTDAGRVAQSYRVLDGVAVSYRTRDGRALPRNGVRMLDEVLPHLVEAVAPTLRTLPVKPPLASTPLAQRTLEEDHHATPTREAVADAWRRNGLVVLEKMVPPELCESVIDVLNRHVIAAAEHERAQPWPKNFADRLRASANRVVPFWDPTVPADRPPVERLMRLGHQLQQIPEIAALYRRPEIVGALGVTLNAPVLVNAVLIDKVPGGSVQFGMHQDSWYLLTEPESLVSMQIVLDDADEENGCLRLLPTPASEGVTMRAVLTESGWKEGAYTHPSPAESEAKPLPLSSGTVLLYTGRTWHASKPNRSNRHRRVLVAQFIDASSRWLAENWLPEPAGGFPRWP
jgi:radical SAM superfamily enzyme YgiQ (UPF0313 family)/ectoine hydroxylase-related dioxygenase (phytanoyl-CoA dioxygenase family)